MWLSNRNHHQSAGSWRGLRIVVALLLLLPLLSAPQSAGADDNNRHSLIDQQRVQDLRTRVAELRTKVEEEKRHHQSSGGASTAALQALQAQVTELQTGVTALGNTNSTLLAALQTAQSQITTLQTKVAALEAAGSGGAGGASFAKYITVDPNPINGVNGPHLIFTGVNVHIRSGSGVTDDGGNPSGLGNLILGYNEVDPANPAQRNGSHNLVGGTMNSFSSFGGVVLGFRNRLSGQYATILGGDSGVASGAFATVLGASGSAASIQFGVAPKYVPAP